MSIQDYNTRLENNNTNLNGIYDAINNLPTLKLQDKPVTPTMEEQTITADESYHGLGNVTVKAVTSEIDSNIVPENIKEGVAILGVEGIAKANNFKINDAGYLFYDGVRLDSINETLNLCENVINTQSMFENCYDLPSVDLSNFDTSDVENMDNMFNMCSSLTSLDLSNFDTSNVNSMQFMFHNCTSLTELDLSNFNTSNVTNMENMFSFSDAITKLNVSSFNTSNVTNMNGMFSTCNNLTYLDLSNFDTSNVTYMENMFYNCGNLTRLDIRNFTFDKIEYSSLMFDYVPLDCFIVVKSDVEKQWVLQQKENLRNVKTADELNIKTIEINTKDINVYNNNKTGKVAITYNGGSKNLFYPEEEGYTLSINGNATIDENGTITLNDNAQVGDKLIITAVSTYDNSITATKEIEIIDNSCFYEVMLNGGQWIDSGEMVDGNIVYKSDDGSYNINWGKSIATIKTVNITNLKLYIRSYAEGDFDFTEAFAVDTEAVRSTGLYHTQGKQSDTEYVECIYKLDGGEHTIKIMYSKDNSVNEGDDRGYFYVGEYS